jgi:hypothetical protein
MLTFGWVDRGNGVRVGRASEDSVAEDELQELGPGGWDAPTPQAGRVFVVRNEGDVPAVLILVRLSAAEEGG